MAIANVALANTFGEFRNTVNETIAVVNFIDNAFGALSNAASEFSTGDLSANTLIVRDYIAANNLTAGRVLFVSDDTVANGISDDDGLLYDNTTNTLYAHSVTVNEITANNLTQDRVALVSSTGKIVDDSGLVFNSSTNTLFTHNAYLNLLHANNITEGGVLVSGASGLIGDDAGLQYEASTNTLYTHAIKTNNISANNLTDGRVAIVGTDGIIQDDSGLTYDPSTDELTTNKLVVQSHIDIETPNDVALPAHAEGRLFYDANNGALAFYNDEANITLQIGQEEYVRVHNDSGSDIPNGSVVYITGLNGGFPTVALGDASNASKWHVIGVATHTITNGGNGYVTTAGIVRGLNTASFSAGADIFLSASTPGGITNVAPSAPNYPIAIGTVVVSDSSEGSILVHITPETFDNLRVIGSTTIDGDLTIGGGLTVLGSQNVISLTNLEVETNFVYLGAGDSITANSFFVTGLNDMTFKGHFEGNTAVTFYVKIDGTSPDTFSWSLDNFSSTEETGVTIQSGVQYELQDGISVLFNANTGHTLNDVWFGAGVPINVDLGIVGNYNEGSQYAHTGVFRDASDGIYKFFQGYYPEIVGSIDPENETFEYASIRVANTTATNVSASGNVAVSGLVTIGQTLTVTGNTSLDNTTVEGTTAFNDDVSINSSINMKTHTVTHNALGSISGATTINLANGTYVSATCTGTTTWSFSGAPSDGTKATGFVLEITNGGGYTQVWPESVAWSSDVAPTLTAGASGVDVLVFITDNAGATWRGALAILDSR